jgi:hypothetical protein
MDPKNMLYVGAGLHVEPVKHFPKTETFVFVDTLPRSECDRPEYFREYFYRHGFVEKLCKKCLEYGFVLKSYKILDENYFVKIMTWKQRFYWFNKIKQTFPYLSPTLFTFYSDETSQTLKYYISTNLKFNAINEKQNMFDGWIISGYLPDKTMLQFLSKNVKVYGYSETCFIDLDEKDNALMYCSTKQFYLCDYETGQQLMEINNAYTLDYEAMKLRQQDCKRF